MFWIFVDLLLGLFIASIIFGRKSKVFYKIACIVSIITVGFLIIVTIISTEFQAGKANLVSIKADSEIEGSGTFLVANIGEEDVYTFYYETSDGGYKKGKINSSNVTIYETDEVEPSIIVYNTGFAGYSWQSLLFLVNLNNGELEFNDDSGKGYTRYEIFVPEGTIVQNFSLE